MDFKHESFLIDDVNSGLHIFAETRDLELVSAGYLVDRFNVDIDPHEPLTAKPLALVLNPKTREGQQIYREHTWIALFRRNYFVLIHHNIHSVFGPHQTKLMYKSRQTNQIFWLASLQTDCIFFSEENISMHLFTHLINYSWNISFKSRKDKIAL